MEAKKILANERIETDGRIERQTKKEQAHAKLTGTNVKYRKVAHLITKYNYVS